MSQDDYKKEQIAGLKKHSDLIVLGILWVISFTTIFFVLFGTNIVSIGTYFGIGGLAALTVLRIITRKHFKIILAVFLFFGCIGLIKFSIATSQLYWGKSDNPSLQFHYGLISIFLLLVLIALNVNSISVMHKDPEGKVEKRPPQSQAYLDKYYNELKEKETADLQMILATPERWQKEYLEAAAKVLTEKQ